MLKNKMNGCPGKNYRCFDLQVPSHPLFGKCWYRFMVNEVVCALYFIRVTYRTDSNSSAHYYKFRETNF